MSSVDRAACIRSTYRLFVVVLLASQNFATPLAFSQSNRAVDRLLTFIDDTGESTPIDDIVWQQLKRHKLEVRDRNGQLVTYEGVLLSDLLQRMGMPFGEELKGAYVDFVVVAQAKDNYRVAFSLVELDPATPGKTVLIADRCNGQPLVEHDGPLRLVLPDEKRHVRWMRMVHSIRVLHPDESLATDAGSQLDRVTR